MDTSGQSLEAGQPPRRSSARKWVLAILVVCGVLFLACAGLCGGVVFFVFNAMKSSPPYRMALERVQKDPQVTQRLGEPIQDVTWFPSGQIKIENDRGEANLNFAVAGPKGRAQVGTMARCVGGTWALVTLDVTFADGQRQSLSTASGPGEETGEAPKWSPGK